jgi:hypothetical protein
MRDRLKCAAATGAVAAPATADDSTTPAPAGPARQAASGRAVIPAAEHRHQRRGRGKGHLEPGAKQRLGRSISTISAAIATARRLSARRSSISATASPPP